MGKIKNFITLCAVGSAIVSCQTEDNVQNFDTSNDNALKSRTELVVLPNSNKFAEKEMSENMGDIFNAVAPSECRPTAFNSVSSKYIQQIIADPLALSENGIYSNVNYYYSFLLDNNDQYFGNDGDYTKLMVKRERELASFWDMQGMITVKGQHTENLDNKDIWVEVLSTFYGYSQPDGTFVNLTIEQASQIADEYLGYNELSPNLPENPYFATDGFASGNKTIVIGDGLVTWLAEAGVDEGIVWTGILAHEWAHQVQFLNYPTWYPQGADPDQATATRYTELEADFLAAYYMTHKRGATYNQKRVEEFYSLFFQIGDCGFKSAGHHGTPAQRMRAANLGFDLANSAQKQGHIMTQQQAHEYFVANVAGIL
ncbi:hypothetical protein [Gillisia sp. Hel_I_29]|uniref:hypothetical protein n=1 Tax=Gillisia sp. Hel_I_29 TaxID=1249975 RepID=UPI0005539C4A|nr:hypothetical protein [Gillisia sp. Hel_I_29]